MKNRKLLLLAIQALSSPFAFSGALVENTKSLDLPTPSYSKSLPALSGKKEIISIDDSLAGQGWVATSNEESDDYLPSLLEIFREAEANAFNKVSFQVQKNSWFVFDPIANTFEQRPAKLSETDKNNEKSDIQTLVKGQKVAIIVHGCDSCKEDMADLAQIIHNNSQLYDSFIFFAYNSKQGIEAIATAYSQGLYDIINTLDKTKGGSTKISIFTHSMGGLINRCALKMPIETISGRSISLMEKIVDRQQDLALVTFGTPHGGVPSLYTSEGILHNIGRVLNYPSSALLYYGHASVRDMMTSDTFNAPSSQSNFLAKLNDGKPWKYSKNLHLFTVAGNTAISYPSYRQFKYLNYVTYDDDQYDGLVTIDSAFHSQLNIESDSWRKDLSHRMVIPANHYNMKASKGKSSQQDSSRVETYHIVGRNGSILLDQGFVRNCTQKDLKVLYNAFQISGEEAQLKFIAKALRNQYTLSSYLRGVRGISDDILVKYKKFSELGYKVEVTRETDMEQMVTQVIKGWLPAIEKTLSYQIKADQIKEAIDKKTEAKKSQPVPQKTKSKGIWNKIKSIF